jgi:hypothetical protein
MWRAVSIAAVGAILALGLVVTIVMTPVWLVSGLRGRLGERGGLTMRLLPFLAYAALLITLGLVGYAVLGSGTSVLTNLAYGPYSQTVFVASILFPLVSLLGFVAAFRTSNANAFVRLYIGLTCLALLAVAGYLGSIGWIGVKTWAMQTVRSNRAGFAQIGNFGD